MDDLLPFTPINFEAVEQKIFNLKRRLQKNGYIIALYLLSRARRKKGNHHGRKLSRGDVSISLHDLTRRIPVTVREVRSVLSAFQEVGFAIP